MAKRPNGRRFSTPEVARQAAAILVKNSFNATAAARELRPHLAESSAQKTGERMLNTPAVMHEVAKLMDKPQRNAKVYVDRLWDWFEGEDKDLAQTAARLLRHGYIGERTEEKEVSKPVLLIDGLREGMERMLGQPLPDNETERPS